MILNRALDILCGRHSRAFKEVQELACDAQKRLVELRDSLHGETESKYDSLCEEVLEAADEEEKREGTNDDGGNETVIKLMKGTKELLFPAFDKGVLDMLFSKTLIAAQTAIDSAGANGLI